MRTVFLEPVFEEWRERARELLSLRVPPAEVLWSDSPQEQELFSPAPAGGKPVATPKVPAAFLETARSVAAHTDPRRWGVLYRVLWRLTIGGERYLLDLAADPEVRQLQLWRSAVGRDIHKMHAFVRFRRVGLDEESGREQFVSWFEPEHRIVRLAAGFFQRRFAGMDWSILTPSECAHWDGVALHFSPGVPRSAAPDEDSLDGLWRTYYRSIFNPARLKVRAMQSEMPRKYWKNLPEAQLIPELVSGSEGRVEKMLRAEVLPVKPAPKNAYLQSLHARNAPAECPEDAGSGEPPQLPSA